MSLDFEILADAGRNLTRVAESLRSSTLVIAHEPAAHGAGSR
jgi:hypothetical protein